MEQITFKQYRTIDLTIWTVLTILFEAITTMASTKWFAGQPVAISITLTLVCVVMMRWSGYAAITALAGGFIFCMISGGSPEQYLIYCSGNLFALLALLLVRAWGKEQIRDSKWKIFFFVLAAYILMAAGRGTVSLLFGGDAMAYVVFATTDIISLLFAVVVLILLKGLDGMIEDQKAYLIRQEKERREKANDIYIEDEY